MSSVSCGHPFVSHECNVRLFACRQTNFWHSDKNNTWRLLSKTRRRRTYSIAFSPDRDPMFNSKDVS